MKKILLIAACIAPLKWFVVEYQIDVHKEKMMAVCADDRIDALSKAIHPTVWTEQEWREAVNSVNDETDKKIKRMFPSMELLEIQASKRQ
jgi:hypothetical protein